MKKQSMNSEENEMQLFHGTKPCNTQYINANNFNRGFAGINGMIYIIKTVLVYDSFFYFVLNVLSFIG